MLHLKVRNFSVDNHLPILHTQLNNSQVMCIYALGIVYVVCMCAYQMYLFIPSLTSGSISNDSLLLLPPNG